MIQIINDLTPMPIAKIQPNTQINAIGITAVVVTYNPDPEQLAELCRLIRPQVEYIELIDNSSHPDALHYRSAPHVNGA